MNNNSPELFQGTNFHAKSPIDTLDEDEAFERDISLNTDDACSSHNHLTDNGSQSNGSCLERYSGQCSLSSEFESYSTSTDIELEFESYSTSTDIELRDISDVKKEDATRSQSPSKLEKIADIIINAVIVKGQQRLIDQDNHEDNITYEKSDKRLIACSLGLAGLCSLSSLICIISVFQAFEVKSKNVLAVPIDESKANIPIPHVAFMNRLRGGSMLVFKQMNKSHFDFAWKFNIPVHNYLHTYFMFEDLSKIHVAYSNMKLEMTVIPTSTLKHFTIPKSKLKQEFIYGFSVRMGNFVMFFGGQNGYGNPDYPDGLDIISTHQCSSVNDNKNKVTTQIWSIKRQVWIKGPYLPLKTGCVDYACGVSINRTHGILFYQPPFMQPCIDAITFSLDTFKWVDIKKCIIFLDTTFILKLTCSSYLNKNGNM